MFLLPPLQPAMKSSRLALTANPCGASRHRAGTAVADAGAPRLLTDRAAWKFVAAATVFCLMALAASAFALQLAWNPSPESDVTGYELSYGTTAGSHASTIAVGNTPTATVTGLQPGTRYFFVVRAVNSAGLKSAASLELSHATAQATPVNTPPVAAGSFAGTKEDTSVPLTLSATDPDGDTLVYQIVTPPVHGTLSGTSPNLTYTPKADFHGADSLTFRASDGQAGSNTATVSINVSPVNDTPVAAGFAVATSIDTPVPVGLSASDKDGDPVTYQIVSPPASGTLSGTAPALAYTPAAGFGGTDSFTYRAGDGKGFSSAATVIINIGQTGGGTRIIARDGWSLVSVDSEENPGNPATAAFDGNPATFWHTRWKSGGTPPPHVITIDTGSARQLDGFRYLPRQDGFLIGNIAEYEFHTSLDGSAWTTAATGRFDNTSAVKQVAFVPRNARYIRLRALGEANGSIHTAVAELDLLGSAAVNQSPIAAPAVVETRPGSPVDLILGAEDGDGDPLVYQIVSGPAHGSISGNAPRLVYTPEAGFSGDDALVFRVHDGIAFSSPATVTIRVLPEAIHETNRPPVFSTSSIAAPAAREGRPYTGGSLAALATDPDPGDIVTLLKLSGPAWLEVTGNGLLRGTPPAGSAGTQEFLIRASDRDGAAAEAVLVIRVEPAQLPLPWNAVEIGPVAGRTVVAHSEGAFRLASPGRLAGRSDAGAFAGQTLSGDGSIIARIGPIANGGVNTRAGLMIRDSFSPGSRHVFIGLNGKGDYRWVRRLGGTETRAADCGDAKPMRSWVKLTRHGGTITAYTSEDGRAWTKAGAAAANFGQHCHIGLFVSGGKGRRASAAFHEVRLVP